MLHLSINERPLSLPAQSRASIEHVNPLFADGLEDSYSVPLEIPAEGNEEPLEHTAELALRDRRTTFDKAALGHQGLPLFPGILHVLSSTARSVRASFSVEGFVSRIRGVDLPDTLRSELIDRLLEEEDSITLKDRPTYAEGGKCRFPMHINRELYGDTNAAWKPDAPTWSDSSTYEVDDLVEFTTYETVQRTGIYQCIDATTAGQSPTTNPAKWRLTAFGVVNAWDEAEDDFHQNTDEHAYYTFVPWFYLKWVLQKALAHVGYTPTGSFMEDTATHELGLANTTTIDPVGSQTQLNFWRAEQTTPYYYSAADPTAFTLQGNDESTTPNQDPDSLWDNSGMEWTCPNAGTFAFRATATFNRSGAGNSGGNPYVRLALVDENGTLRAYQDLPAVSVPSGDATRTGQVSVALSALDVGLTFRLYMRQYYFYPGGGILQPPQLVQVWPALSSDHYVDSVVSGWQEEDEPEVLLPDQFIHPHRHVPEVALESFLVEVATALNLELTPDEATRTLRLDYREDVPRNLERLRTHASERVLNVQTTELDHERATRGLTFRWDMETNQDRAENLVNATPYFSEEDLPAPGTTGMYAVMRGTRKLFKSVFIPEEGAFVWQPQGWHVPEVSVGDPAEAVEVVPGCKPVHMEQLQLDGKKYMVPVLDALGTSAWFHTEGDRTAILLCEMAPQRSADGTETGVPGARSWGWGWDYLDRTSFTLLPDQTDTVMPGLWQRCWELWSYWITKGEPVTMDLLVDAPFLKGREWRRVLTLHGQDYLVQRLPVEYGAHHGQLVSRGAHLLRIKHHPPVVQQVETFDHCALADRYPSTLVEVGDWSYAQNRAAVEGTTPTPGDRYFILEHNAGSIGTDIWELHTGDVAIYVGGGGGEAGSDWDFEVLPSGALVGVSGEVIWQVVTEDTSYSTIYSSNGGTGRFGLSYKNIFPDGDLLPPNTLITQDTHFGTYSNRTDYIDECRRCQLQYTTDFVDWYDIGEPFSEQQALTEVVVPELPEGTIAVRGEWTRGAYLQIHSDFGFP